nr:hypothetical protein [Candidatus Bathyarchaeota archaeon]
MGWVLAIVSLIVLIFGLVLAAEKLLKASTAIVLILGIIELILGAATMGTLGMALLAVLGGIIAIIGAAVAILVEGAFA